MLSASKNRAAVSRRESSKEDHSLSPARTATCSECGSSEHSLDSVEIDLEGVAAPSATCDQRMHSVAVVSRSDTTHKLLAHGRPRMVLPRVLMGNQKSEAESATTASASSSSTGASADVPDYALIPPALRTDAWEEANAAEFEVRGKNYTVDQKKVPSMESVFRLLVVDLVKVDQPIYSGLCSHPDERIQTALRREQETGIQELPAFIYAVNLAIPGNKTNYHWVAYFGVDDVSVLKDETTALGRVAAPFFFGNSDEYRNKTFKLIPRIVQGNYVVRKAVGSKPSILGSKLQHHYIRTDRFLEMVVDIGSCKMAQKVVKLASGYAKTLVVDMMFLLEGVDETTLPERILGGVRLVNLDFKHKDGQRLCRPPPH